MQTNYIQIIAEQKQECTKILQSGWVIRISESSITVDSKLAQIISGIRRSGKSTLAHRILSNYHYAYINFDDERLSLLNPENLNLLLEATYAVYGDFEYLLLDEIQNIDNWHLFVNRLLRNNIKVFLTGSNSKLLSKEMATHLTGRYNAIELFPFSFKEYLIGKNQTSNNFVTAKERGLLQNYFNEYMESGGFPEITTGENLLPYVNNLFEAIISRDIVFRYHIRFARTLHDIAIYLFDNYGNQISYNRIKSIFDLGSENTAKNYVFYLEEAYLIACLPKFSFKKQESLRYRKVYLIDTAFSALVTKNKGRLLENIVFLQLKRFALMQNYEIYYFKKTIEVDFVLYKNRKVIQLIQVCYSLADLKTKKREIKSLILASEELKSDDLKIITMTEEEILIQEEKRIHIVPVVKWLLDFELEQITI